jgi:Lsr2
VAKKRLWSLVDDFDGSPGAETITFAFDGTKYEIDLSVENAAEFRDVLQPWMDAGRTRGRKTATVTRRPSSRPANGRGRRARYDSNAVREWAASDASKRALRAASLKAPAARGRISTAVVDTYNGATDH